jgi:hypothetical protein
MISLAITAMLLTAVAAAFTASAQAIGENDDFFRATQAGRVSINHFLTEIRTGTIDAPSNSYTLRLITAPKAGGGGEEDRTYQWRSADKKLYLVTNDDTTDPDYVLASNVTSATFSAEMGKDYNNTDCVARITVTLVVTIGNNAVRLSGSAAPTKNLIY